MIQFSSNTNYPKSKAPLQSIQTLQSYDILMTSMDTESETEEYTLSSNRYCNELNSFLVENADCNQVLNVLNNILTNYNDDIDFNIDYNNKRIHDGLVFISNQSLYFIIYIWEENKKQTRFEFRRTSGDCLISAKFWSQIKCLYQQQIDNKKNTKYNQFDFISLDLGSLNNENNNNGHLSKSELDELTTCLIENDLYVIDELNFLYESVVENKNICFDILSHGDLMKTMINQSLLNKDIAISRIALLILEELSKIPNNNITNIEDFKLFQSLSLLLNHERGLIKKYTVRLLANLLNNTWSIDDISKNQMIENIKKYKNECTNNLIKEIINKINQKLLINE